MITINFQELYSERLKSIIEDHDQKNPLFLYVPLQTPHIPYTVPEEYLDLYPNEEDLSRKTLLGMVTFMDDVIGALVTNLKSKDMYENSIIVFVSDNGGSRYNGGVGSNLPLRGGKFTVYEGGIRTPAFIHGPKFIPKSG